MKRLLLILVMLVALGGMAAAAVNINIATKEDLTSLKGVGEKRAQDIIDYRMKNGPFKTVDDLEKVPGVTPAFMKQIRPQISTSGSSVIKRPAKSAPKRKAKGSTAKTASPVKSYDLKSDKASKKIAEKLTTRAKVEEKKTK